MAIPLCEIGEGMKIEVVKDEDLQNIIQKLLQGQTSVLHYS